MGMYEDLFYEIIEELDSKGLRKEFDEQLEKMSYQSKHQHKDTRDKWSYAHSKVIKNYYNKKV